MKRKQCTCDEVCAQCAALLDFCGFLELKSFCTGGEHLNLWWGVDGIRVCIIYRAEIIIMHLLIQVMAMTVLLYLQVCSYSSLNLEGQSLKLNTINGIFMCFRVFSNFFLVTCIQSESQKKKRGGGVQFKKNNTKI